MPAELRFPHLDNGCVSQLPIKLEIERIEPHNLMADGEQIVNASEACKFFVWRYQLRNLNFNEASRMEEFLLRAHRTGVPFPFYDPLGNLLRQSNSLRAAAWVVSPGLIVDSIEDEQMPTAEIITNATPQELTITQAIALPEIYAGCFSLYARWQGGASIQLAQVSGTTSVAHHAVAGNEWSRHAVYLRGQGTASSRLAQLRIPPFTQVIVAQPQMEVSMRPGAYMASGIGGGIHQAQLRVAEVTQQSDAPGVHHFNLSIESVR
jgi:hypothetical protein